MRDLRIWFDPPLFRWSRVLAVALLGVLATVAWLAYERGMWGVPAVEPGVVLAPAASGAAARPQAVVRTPSMPLVTAPLRSTPPAGRGEAPAIGAAARDDCSLAVRTAASDATGADPLRDARSRWLAALEASADAPVRAAGLLWTVRAPASAVADDTRQRARDRLARLAVESPDPVVYGFAMLACEGVRGAGSPGGACQMLSPDQWVRVDADNAAVWLAVAERAAAGSPAQAEALRRAASAGSLRMHANDLLPLARRVMPPALPEVARTLLSGELVGVQSGVTLPIGGATEYCGRAQVADANRRGECEALATMFVERGGSLAHLIAGRAVAESLGWPAERLAALRRESETLAPLTVVSPADTGCRAIDRRTQRALDAARYGELGALRREWQAAATAASGVAVTNRP